MSDVGCMLAAPGSAVEVIGRVALDKFAAFAEELRKSRSRTISLGVVGVAPGAAPMDAAYMHELLRGYSSKGRIGKLGLAKEVEGYLVARSGEWCGASQCGCIAGCNQCARRTNACVSMWQLLRVDGSNEVHQ